MKLQKKKNPQHPSSSNSPVRHRFGGEPLHSNTFTLNTFFSQFKLQFPTNDSADISGPARRLVCQSSGQMMVKCRASELTRYIAKGSTSGFCFSFFFLFFFPLPCFRQKGLADSPPLQLRVSANATLSM